MLEKGGAHENKVHIRQVIVTKLFGNYNYVIQAPEDRDSADLLIIFGENGSGKTTILNLLYHTLATDRLGGHKTFISETPFQQFSVELSDGASVKVTKFGDRLVGAFKFDVTTVSGLSNTFQFKVDKDGKVKPSSSSIQESIDAVVQLGVSLYFVPDDRKVQSGLIEMRGAEIRSRDSYYSISEIDGVTHTFYDPDRRAAMNRGQSDSHHLQIKPVIDALFAWLRNGVIAGANTGEENASSIYLRVMGNLGAIEAIPFSQPAEPDYDFRETIEDLDADISMFAQYGLLPGFPAEKFVDQFELASLHNQNTIRAILRPYLDGLKARLNALRELYDVIHVYSTTLNSFFSGKIVQVNAQRGISVILHSSGELDLNMLSSGEKQLMLLFSNTVLARRTSSIFIIDEPELSLNIKWQRNLIGALLRCASGGGTQFVVASHSLELLSQYRSSARQLRNVVE